MNSVPASAFSAQEIEQRLIRVREDMTTRGLSACLISSPENIYYITGLDHWGFFALHLLIVPQVGPLYLVTRAMEAPTVKAQAPQVVHVGYEDYQDPAQIIAKTLQELGLPSGHIGTEQDTLFNPPRVAYSLVEALPHARWEDISGLVDEIRQCKSDQELAYVRQAAQVTQAMMQAAIDTAREGVNERQIAAEVHRAMILAGGDYPGFGPFIRSTPTLDQEHVTWQDRQLVAGDRVFLEMAGCVRRYHAPMGRLLFVGRAPAELEWIRQVTWNAFDRVVEAIHPGAEACQVYQAWQGEVDRAGLSHYRRHHCGYLLGIGFPPSWVGGNKVIGLRSDSHRILQKGMVMHLLSWLVGSGRGDFFISNAATVTATGCEVLTRLPEEVNVV